MNTGPRYFKGLRLRKEPRWRSMPQWSLHHSPPSRERKVTTLGRMIYFMTITPLLVDPHAKL